MADVARLGSGTRPRILFVDDDPALMADMRRCLWAQRDDWELLWAPTDADALDLLGCSEVDILVTDLQMPGTDGSDLLETARRQHPATARIVLSRSTDHERILGVAGPTQQFLAKPCDRELLVGVLTHAVETRRLMADEALRALFGTLTQLPKPPGIYHELTALTGRTDTSVAEIARLVERDVGVTAELLKLINSSFFGLARDVTTIDRAIAMLGLDVLKALVLAGSVFTSAVRLPAGLDAGALAGRGLMACLALERIGRAEGWESSQVSRLALAALLHDVGLLVLAACRPTAWASYCTADPARPARVRQQEELGCTVGRASAYLLGLWGFDGDVVAALADQPLDLADPVARGGATPAALAVAFAHSREVAPGVPVEPGGYLTEQRLRSWQAQLR